MSFDAPPSFCEPYDGYPNTDENALNDNEGGSSHDQCHLKKKNTFDLFGGGSHGADTDTGFTTIRQKSVAYFQNKEPIKTTSK